MEAHVDLRVSETEVAEEHLVEKVGHDRFSKPDLVSLMDHLEPDASRKQAE